MIVLFSEESVVHCSCPCGSMPHLVRVAMVIVLQSPYAADELELLHQKWPALHWHGEVPSLSASHKGNTMSDDQERETAKADGLSHARQIHLLLLVVVVMVVVIVMEVDSCWWWHLVVVMVMHAERGQLYVAQEVTLTLLDSALLAEPAQCAEICAAPHACPYDTLGQFPIEKLVHSSAKANSLPQVRVCQNVAVNLLAELAPELDKHEPLAAEASSEPVWTSLRDFSWDSAVEYPPKLHWS